MLSRTHGHLHQVWLQAALMGRRSAVADLHAATAETQESDQWQRERHFTCSLSCHFAPDSLASMVRSCHREQQPFCKGEGGNKARSWLSPLKGVPFSPQSSFWPPILTLVAWMLHCLLCSLAHGVTRFPLPWLAEREEIILLLIALAGLGETNLVFQRQKILRNPRRETKEFESNLKPRGLRPSLTSRLRQKSARALKTPPITKAQNLSLPYMNGGEKIKHYYFAWLSKKRQ